MDKNQKNHKSKNDGSMLFRAECYSIGENVDYVVKTATTGSAFDEHNSTEYWNISIYLD